MSRRWSDEMAIKFTELYKEKEHLWNQYNELYKNKNVRETALGGIAAGMNIPDFGVSDVKTKIKALRATFNGELPKMSLHGLTCLTNWPRENGTCLASNLPCKLPGAGYLPPNWPRVDGRAEQVTCS